MFQIFKFHSALRKSDDSRSLGHLHLLYIYIYRYCEMGNDLVSKDIGVSQGNFDSRKTTDQI